MKSMPNLSSISMTLPDDQLIEAVAQGNVGAAVTLRECLKRFTQNNDAGGFRLLVVDIIDMELSGEQLWVAWDVYCGKSFHLFVDLCKARDEGLIARLNSDPDCAGNTARRHGPQTTPPPSKINDAIRRSIAEAEEAGTLTRLDEGSEAITRLFVTMFREMIARKNYVTNIKVNLGLEGGQWGTFAVQLVEILNPDGTPYRPPEPRAVEEEAPAAALPSEPEGARGEPDLDIDRDGNYFPGRETTGEDHEASVPEALPPVGGRERAL
jgi:hypothetical protein